MVRSGDKDTMCIGSTKWTPLGWDHSFHLRRRPWKKHSSLRVLRLYRRRKLKIPVEWKVLGGMIKREMMEMKNLKLFVKNQSIIRENEMLRKRALLLHQENAALLILLHNKFSLEQNGN